MPISDYAKADKLQMYNDIALANEEIVRLRRVAEIAERICAKMEHPTASVTIIDQTDLRAALDTLKD